MSSNFHNFWNLIFHIDLLVIILLSLFLHIKMTKTFIGHLNKSAFLNFRSLSFSYCPNFNLPNKFLIYQISINKIILKSWIYVITIIKSLLLLKFIQYAIHSLILLLKLVEYYQDSSNCLYNYLINLLSIKKVKILLKIYFTAKFQLVIFQKFFKVVKFILI